MIDTTKLSALVPELDAASAAVDTAAAVLAGADAAASLARAAYNSALDHQQQLALAAAKILEVRVVV